MSPLLTCKVSFSPLVIFFSCIHSIRIIFPSLPSLIPLYSPCITPFYIYPVLLRNLCHIHEFLFYFLTHLLLTRAVSETMDLKLFIGTWWAHQWIHIWRQWLPSSQNLSEANRSSLSGRVPWSTSLPVDDCWQGQSPFRPSASNHICYEFMIPCLQALTFQHPPLQCALSLKVGDINIFFEPKPQLHLSSASGASLSLHSL